MNSPHRVRTAALTGWHLASAQSTDNAKFIGRDCYFTNEKAGRDLGFAPRPLRDSLNDAFAFWQSIDGAKRKAA